MSYIVSENIVSYLKKKEGLKLKAYLPTKNDRWTIGYGSTYYLNGEKVKEGDRITFEEADRLLRCHVLRFETDINALVKVPLHQYQFDALVSFVYNIGTANFKRSTLLQKLNLGDFLGASNEFLRWNKQKNPRTGGFTILSGLTIRRKEERDLFLNGIYS